MGKRVVIIASGETERRALPHLTAHLEEEGVALADVVIPPGHSDLKVDMVQKLIARIWFAPPDGVPPDKIVILVDADGLDPQVALQPLKDDLSPRLSPKVTASIQLAYAQWHLEAWYFADDKSLRQYLGRDLGSVDTSQPDSIHNPKLHLKHLLGDRVYSSVVSEEIAVRLKPEVISQRSASFSGLLDAMRNGDQTTRSEQNQNEANRERQKT